MAGVLTIPMVFGMLASSVGSGQLITKYGKWKSFVVAGAGSWSPGSCCSARIDHETKCG